MLRIHGAAMLLGFLAILLSVRELGAQGPGNGSSLDGLIRTYAYKTLIRPRTGVIYAAQLPPNATGIRASVMRLRSGSFAKRGVPSFHEFEVPSGLRQSPPVVRIALVYQNLGNWSSEYYPLPEHRFLGPVLGLLAYDATNLSSPDPREVELAAARRPISIRFGNLSAIPSNHTAKCAQLHANGSVILADLIDGSLCRASRLGHFAVVVHSSSKSAPPPAPVPAESGDGFRFNRAWRTACIAVGASVGLLLLAALLLCLRRLRRRDKMSDMVKRSEGGEVLKRQKVGSAYLPAASMIRTRPVLENDCTPPQLGGAGGSA